MTSVNQSFLLLYPVLELRQRRIKYLVAPKVCYYFLWREQFEVLVFTYMFFL